jgi:hypothetical protein
MLPQLDTAIAFVVVMLMLSLMVTAAVQMIAALLDLRGKNLVRGLTDLFHQISPDLRGVVAADSWLSKLVSRFTSRNTFGFRLAEFVVRHPTVAHGFSRAKAIRPDELLAVLQDLSADTTSGNIDADVKTKLKDLLASRLPGAAATVDTAQALADKLATQFPALKNDITTAVQNTLGSISKVEAGIGKWFNTIMDRASDIFTRWTRVITVAVAALIVIVLHIDSGLILHQISSTPELKAGLTKMADATLVQADKIFDNGNRATKALMAVADQHKGQDVEPILRKAPNLVRCVDGSSWLEQNAKALEQASKATTPGSALTSLETEFESACQEQTRLAMANSGNQLRNINSQLAGTELTIVPHSINGRKVFTRDDAYPNAPSIENWAVAYYASPRHLLGTLVMVFLLSLGAPFWFNALRQLSNLKPGISTKIEQEHSSS